LADNRRQRTGRKIHWRQLHLTSRTANHASLLVRPQEIPLRRKSMTKYSINCAPFAARWPRRANGMCGMRCGFCCYFLVPHEVFCGTMSPSRSTPSGNLSQNNRPPEVTTVAVDTPVLFEKLRQNGLTLFISHVMIYSGRN
jgi:hypothetical protein